MSIEGLWTIEFSKSEEEVGGFKIEEQMNRGGIIVLFDKKLLGGGLSYYFVGSYKVSGSDIDISLDAIKYNDIVSGPFGTTNKASVFFKGTITGNSMTLRGHVEDNPNNRLLIRAEHRI
ncbi:MAG: hypothetical protein ACRESK_08700 [Gammaproteobacteria bacterium]